MDWPPHVVNIIYVLNKWRNMNPTFVNLPYLLFRDPPLVYNYIGCCMEYTTPHVVCR